MCEIKSSFAEKFRNVLAGDVGLGLCGQVLVADCPDRISVTTRALFASSEASDESIATLPPPGPVDARPPSTRTRSTNLSVPEAKRERFLAPCACECPLGIASGPTKLVSCETQTCVPDSSSLEVQTSASEQGAIQLAYDGWAETQKKIHEISTFMFGLRSHDSRGFIVIRRT